MWAAAVVGASSRLLHGARASFFFFQLLLLLLLLLFTKICNHHHKYSHNHDNQITTIRTTSIKQLGSSGFRLLFFCSSYFPFPQLKRFICNEDGPCS